MAYKTSYKFDPFTGEFNLELQEIITTSGVTSDVVPMTLSVSYPEWQLPWDASVSGIQTVATEEETVKITAVCESDVSRVYIDGSPNVALPNATDWYTPVLTEGYSYPHSELDFTDSGDNRTFTLDAYLETSVLTASNGTLTLVAYNEDSQGRISGPEYVAINIDNRNVDIGNVGVPFIFPNHSPQSPHNHYQTEVGNLQTAAAQWNPNNGVTPLVNATHVTCSTVGGGSGNYTVSDITLSGCNIATNDVLSLEGSRSFNVKGFSSYNGTYDNGRNIYLPVDTSDPTNTIQVNPDGVWLGAGSPVPLGEYPVAVISDDVIFEPYNIVTNATSITN